MSWFDGVFLPSMLEKAGAERAAWMTARQTAVCARYMRKESVRELAENGMRYEHIRFAADWNGREVTVAYSKLNGCGRIFFGSTAEERAAAEKLQQEQREQREADRIRRIRESPERLAREIGRLEQIIAVLRDNADAAEEDGDNESAEYYREEQEKAEKRLALLKA